MTVSRKMLVGVALAIFAGAVWLYWPSTRGGFLKVDDQEYLRQSIRWKGLTWNAVKWAFTCTDMYYQPLVRLSHVVDYQFWGMDAAGHHAISVFLHALNAALVFGFLWTLLGAAPLRTGERLIVAAWVAVVFAIHPLQTEAVAWMAVRTQLLCTAFGIGSLWAYAAGARRWAVGGLYVAALLCKPTAIALPFIMLAMDYFPLRRHERLGWGQLVREKAVLIGLAGVMGVATVITESRGGASTAPAVAVPLLVRVFHVFHVHVESLTFYLLKLDLPSHLSPYYFLDVPPAPWTVLAAALIVVAAIVTAAVVMERRCLPMLAAAWGVYVMLVLLTSTPILADRPVVAMRYAYEAMLPLLLLTGAAGVWVWRRSRPAVRGALVGLLACQLGAFAIITHRLIPDWRSDEAMRWATVTEFPGSEEANRTLATELTDQGRNGEALEYAQRSVALGPQVCEAHVIDGRVLCELGRFSEALVQGEEAMQLNPDSARANFTLGLAQMKLGGISEAAEDYEQAVRLDPDFAEARCNLGLVLMHEGRLDEAIGQFERAIQIKPDSAELHNNLGMALVSKGRLDEAIAHYKQAVWIQPDLTEAQYNLGVALALRGRLDDAITHFERAVRLRPAMAEAHCSLGGVLVRKGRLQEAIAHYEQALRITPHSTVAHSDLGIALAETGRLDEAIDQFQQALRTDPNSVEVQYNLGIALVQAGRMEDAIGHFEQVVRLRPNDAETHCALGSVLEQVGRVQEAVGHYQEAVRIKPDFTVAQNALARLQAER